MSGIVAGYDRSEQSERALVRAAQLAQALDASLVVVSVGSSAAFAETAPAFEPALVPTPIGPLPADARLTKPAPPPDAPPDAQLALEQARRLLTPRGVEAEYVCEMGDPADRLLAVADARDADLIVVGCPEHGLLGRLLGHSVDEQLPRRTRRDVLLVH